MFSDGPARVGTDYSFYGYGTVGTVFSTVGTVGTVGTVWWVRWVRWVRYGGYGTVGTTCSGYVAVGTVGTWSSVFELKENALGCARGHAALLAQRAHAKLRTSENFLQRKLKVAKYS